MLYSSMLYFPSVGHSSISSGSFPLTEWWGWPSVTTMHTFQCPSPLCHLGQDMCIICAVPHRSPSCKAEGLRNSYYMKGFHNTCVSREGFKTELRRPQLCSCFNQSCWVTSTVTSVLHFPNLWNAASVSGCYSQKIFELCRWKAPYTELCRLSSLPHVAAYWGNYSAISLPPLPPPKK